MHVTEVSAEYTSPGSTKRLEHEYALRGELGAAWAARPIALSRHDDRLTLVRENPGGEPLDRVLGGAPLPVTQFLRIAVPLAAALRRMHERGLIHKDIKPANILADVANGAAWLTGFGIASRLPRERQNPEAPEVIAGTLAYMAPEQTGRMNRSIDSRSDLYALGITFYEMLTGRLPFTAFEPMEWIHCHIARQPTPPGERVAGLPAPLEAIVMKLLAKTGEERYQTAAGVEADLRRCLAAWISSGQIEPFPLGAQDASDKLMVPEHLYGREREIETLLAAFDRVVANGATELVLVSGYAGIGKSSVVNELHKVLVPPRGRFAAGKFDQYKRDIPYATLAQAFQSLVRELLSKSDAEVAPWRAELLEALGPNVEVMVNLIPELAHLVGVPPPIPALPPQDAQNRFQLVFRRFLGVFARPEHPLALFVDDLQWLDTATLDLLQHLVTHPEVRHLLLVGAYRNNEVGPSHPLVRTLEVIRADGGRVHETVLAPLMPDSVGQLVADTFHCDRDTAQPLAQLVHDKTAGNPFFAIQFLTALSEEALIAFEHNSARWTWDMPRIRAKGFTANVADLMASKLSRLPDPTREALGQLACLGNVAEVATLSLVHGASADTLHAALWEAVRAGLIFPADGGAYAFVHDRVQEAAYALIPDGERPAVHLRIGRALASRTAPEQLEETIFDIVNHLNQGATLLTVPAERERVVKLNLLAGQRARNSTAYASARNYLAQAATLLSPDAWKRGYQQTFDLYLAASECEYLVGNFSAADALFDLLLAQACSNLDRAKVYSLRMKLYQVAGKYDDGFAAALEALRDFAVTLPESTEGIQEAVAEELRNIPLNLGGRSISALLEAPAAADPATRAIIDLLVEAMPCAYIGRPLLFPLITLKAVNLSLRHGHTDQSSYVYGNYAVMLVSLGEIAAGVEFSEMSLRLNEKFNNPRLRGKLLHLHGDHINFWRCHIATDLPILEQAIRACLEVGDHVFAGYLAFETLWQVIETGAALEEVQVLSVHYAAFAGQSHNDAVCETIRLEQRFAASLQGKTAALGFEDHGDFNEAACFATLVKANFGCGIVFYYIMKQMLAFCGGRYAEALDFADRAQSVLGAAMGMPIEATFHYFHALTLAALYPTVGLERQQQYRESLAEKLEKFALWARHSPENYSNRHALVAAEIAAMEGRDTEAMRLYEAAISAARESSFIHNQAIAHELAARFYAARGFETIADTYLRNARHCYMGWGAAGKVRQLERTYPRLREAPAHLPPSSTIETPQEQLDLATVLKTSLAVSGEIVLDRLVETLMTLAVEHAGAERALLVRSYGDEQRIEAEATTGRERVLVRLLGTQATPAELPASVLQYVTRTQESVILDDAAVQSRFSADEYLRRKRVRSMLCLPLVKQAKLIGVLYLENNLVSGAFTPARIAVLKLLSSQAAISLENARLYADLVHENRDRKKAEAALRRSEASLTQAQQISSTGNWRWKIGTGEVISSAQLLRIFGFDPATEQPSQPTLMERSHPEDRAEFQRALAEAVRTRSRFQHEFRIALPDGAIKHLQCVGQPDIADADDIEFIGTVMDITQRKQAEEALRSTQADLARVARLTTMGELVASIAHEINQPLAAVVTSGTACLRWLDRAEPDIDAARKSVLRIVRDAGRAGEVIHGLRSLAKKSGPQLMRLDLNDAIQEVLALTRSELQARGVALHTTLSSADRPVVGDRVQLQQVLLNLILNGVEAMSVITDRPKVLAITSEPVEPGGVLVAVEDTGPGLDPATADRIFDPFFTTKPDGMGMGLSICRSIIDAHGGRFWAAPRKPWGTVFRFTVPRESSAA
jgi:PAS domain S-box-containing protein